MMNHGQMPSAEFSSDRNAETKQASAFTYQMYFLYKGHPQWLRLVQLPALLVKMGFSEVLISIFGYSSNFD